MMVSRVLPKKDKDEDVNENDATEGIRIKTMEDGDPPTSA